MRLVGDWNEHPVEAAAKLVESKSRSTRRSANR
jgi:hypothetical protein